MCDNFSNLVPSTAEPGDKNSVLAGEHTAEFIEEDCGLAQGWCDMCVGALERWQFDIVHPQGFYVPVEGIDVAVLEFS